MKIIIEETVKIKSEVDVSFPIYRKSWLYNSTIYTKVENLDKQVSIHIYDDENKVELEIDELSFWGSRAYLLGEGQYKSDKEEFENAIYKLKSFVNYC